MANHHSSPVPIGLVQRAIVISGALIVLFLWVMFYYHNDQIHDERLKAEAAEHLNLSVIIAENLRQMADRAKAAGGIYRSEQQQGGDVAERLSRLLAGDPVFNRLSVFGARGQLLFASHEAGLAVLPPAWLERLHSDTEVTANEPFIPPALGDAQTHWPFPNWRLPFLVPLAGSDGQVMLVEMDIGYLVSLYHYIDLGQTGFIQLLDASNRERMRADSSGVIIGGATLSPAPGQDGSAVYTSRVGSKLYQSAFHGMPQHGFTVVISKQYDEILQSFRAGQSRQLLFNGVMTLAVLICVFWMVRMLHGQQAALRTLQQSQGENQQLIARLESEHERSSRAASTDHLSGLFNRRQFIEVASRQLVEQRSRRRLLAVLFIDLDRFKSINDTLGHRIGDLLLQAVAGRITRLLEPGDEAARFGGDEFVVLLAGSRTEQQIISWVDQLTQRLSAPYQLEDSEVNTSPSIGISICPRDGQDVDSLIRHADAAMYSAKRAGRGRYRFFDPSLNVADVQEFYLEQAFGEALAKHQFVLHYQPQIDLDSMSVTGYEALVRWKHPDFGLIYPDRFISIAERSGFIIGLGEEVITLACRQLAAWGDEGLDTRVAVNVSAIQLSQPHFSSMVLRQLAETGVETWRLELEITETAILEKESMAIASLETLRAAGLGVSLDDFGSGYAGFAHLQSLPVNKLKIDRGLIAQLSNSHDDSLIVSFTITLAKRLSLRVVAEGVETPEQLVYLRLAGCDLVQGYHFSRPMPAEQVAEFERGFHATKVNAE
ncbi:GGDEF-domain containing protein [Pseudomonas sp. G11-1]|uniref:putative bifunctional diguanylate cyclase/phosphodiesterase n=1 Tax=Halopseudomonas sp. SMJS2 TaxID=3041098 RepID=UPI002452C7EB|nr:EAL domain-containing protein [Halopseudomonas sp. SMJS2]MCO5785406.1 GGDEF-domain containing protein [Pseudomonas sp. G11-1]MCO5788490.1 GGDEF-domain containing protein [Pseudomonas sp. G11-2]WGK61008.1 EAL domain-containing protein [Halopseudomonas sp. SMJS2]